MFRESAPTLRPSLRQKGSDGAGVLEPVGFWTGVESASSERHERAEGLLVRVWERDARWSASDTARARVDVGLTLSDAVGCPLQARGAPPPGGVSARLEGAGRAQPRSGEHGPGEAGRHLGSATHVTDSRGELVSSQRFLAYGKARDRRGAAPLRGYIGKDGEGDPDLGLVRMGARWYAPELGRWVSPERLIGQSPGLMAGRLLESGLYGYAAGNPIMGKDPTGLLSVNAALLKQLMLEVADLDKSVGWLASVADSKKSQAAVKRGDKTFVVSAGLVAGVNSEMKGDKRAIGIAVGGGFLEKTFSNTCEDRRTCTDDMARNELRRRIYHEALHAELYMGDPSSPIVKEYAAFKARMSGTMDTIRGTLAQVLNAAGRTVGVKYEGDELSRRVSKLADSLTEEAYIRTKTTAAGMQEDMRQMLLNELGVRATWRLGLA